MQRSAQLEALIDINRRFAEASATGDLSAPVEHCPGWTARDLVMHLGEVQAIWARIVSERITDGDVAASIQGPTDDVDAVAYLIDASAQMVAALDHAPDDTAVWMWFKPQQNVGFVLRRQVIEAAVHLWDLENALAVSSGTEPHDIPTEVALLGLSEFVDTMSTIVPDDFAPAGSLSLEPDDAIWHATMFADVDPIISLVAPASDLLLLCWQRNESGDRRIDDTIGALDLN